jgi:hypothetical protein
MTIPKNAKIAIGWIALCLLSLLRAGSIGQSESFQNCEHERKNHKKYKLLHEERTVVVKSVVRLNLHIACTVESAHENEGPLTLLATILVAGFTGTLWFETNRLWRAGEKQIAIAKISAEPPRKAPISRRLLSATWSVHTSSLMKSILSVEPPWSDVDIEDGGTWKIKQETYNVTPQN